MVDRAEHIIRCLIIWMAWARLRSGLVEPIFSPLLARGSHPGRDPGLDALRPTLGRDGLHTSDCAGAECPEPQAMEQHSSIENKNAPVHHLYSIRGLPLYDLRVAPFKVSLPSETDRSSLRTQGSGCDVQDSRFRGNERFNNYGNSLEHDPLRERRMPRSGRSKRIRNDKVFTSEILVMRMERLGKLYDEIDTRAARVAGLWLGRLSPDLLARDPRRASDALRPTLGRDGLSTNDGAGAECPKPQAMEPHSSKRYTSADPNENWGPHINSENEPDELSEAWIPACAGISVEQGPEVASHQLSRSPDRASGTQADKKRDPGSAPGKAGVGSDEPPPSHIAPQDENKETSEERASQAKRRRSEPDPGFNPGEECSRAGLIKPIKSPDPPPDMMEAAPEDERDDVLALHDAAIRAAELFSRHCV